MLEHKVDLRTKKITLDAESPSGLYTYDLDIPEQYDIIVGIAVFIHSLPTGFNDAKFNIASSTKDYFNLTTSKIFESNSGVAPNDKFFDIEIPCSKDLVTQLKLKTDIDIPLEEKLEFDVVMKVINSKDFEKNRVVKFE